MKFSKGANGTNLSFPLTQSAVSSLKDTRLASPQVGKMHGIRLPSDLTSNLSKHALEVVSVVGMVSRGEFPREFMEKYYPEIWGEFPEKTPEPLVNERLFFKYPLSLANVVHMDNPMDMPNAVLNWVLKSGYNVKTHSDDYVNFLDSVPEVVAATATTVSDNLKKAFEVKYYHGLARPEEVIGSNFTVYDEGCPTHPSLPAGHAAAAAGVTKIIEMFDLDDYAIKMIRDTAYCWSMFRTFAGVHYGLDSIAGLALCGLIPMDYYNSHYMNMTV